VHQHAWLEKDYWNIKTEAHVLAHIHSNQKEKSAQKLKCRALLGFQKD
jgi:hypothetical protein